MAVGVSGYMAVYDLQSNTRLGRVDLRSLPVEISFAPDGSIIIVVVQDWIVYSVSTSSWKARVLVPRRAKMDKPLESCLLAVAPGHNPFIYFCRYAKDTLRLGTLPSRAGGGVAVDGGAAATASGSGGGGRGDKASSWGTRVKLDVQKAILGLACHHVDAQLLVLTADGQLRGYAIAGSGGDVLAPLYAVQVQDPADKVVPPAGVLSCVPHPGLAAGALILQGSRLGTATVLEAPGRSAPVTVLRGRVPGHSATIGMGVCRDAGVVLAFGLNETGRLRCAAWRLSYRPGSTGVVLRQARVDPLELSLLLDSSRRNKAMLATAMASSWSAAAAAGGGVGDLHRGPTALSYGIGMSGGGAISSGGAAGPAGAAGGSAAAAVQAVSGTCHALWGLAPAWSHDVPSSFLLEPQLGPTPGRVVMHPSLGLVAVAPDPPRGAALKEVMFAGRGGLGIEEAALARRTSSVTLLLINNLEAHAAGWRGARLAPQHTPLSAWLPPQLQRLHQQQHQPAIAPPQAAGAQAAADSSDEEEGERAADGSEGAAARPGEGTGGAAATPAAPAAEGLTLPPHVYYLVGNKLMKYALVTRTASPMVTLPVEGTDGEVRTPRQLLHSPRRGAWLVFMESGTNGASAVSSGGAGSTERFTWGLINAASFVGDGGVAVMPWLRSGKSGCFLGADDAHFCIMSTNGKLLEVFDTAVSTASPGGIRPLLSLTLEGAVLLPGLGAPVFPGPPMTNAPVPEARAPPEAPSHDPRRFRGSGVVLWQSGDNALSMTTLPALERVPLEPPATGTSAAAAAVAAAAANGDNSDSDDSAVGGQPYYPSVPVGHFFGPQQRQAHLPLLPNEIVIHVAWQNLALVHTATPAHAGHATVTAPATASATAPAGSGAGPADAVAAVLTTQRLLLVTAGLRVVCAVNLATHGSPALLEPLSSVLWAGPMLLVSTAGGQVLQLTWTGSLLPLATVSPTGHCALVGVTADSMLLLRSPLGVLPTAVATAAAGAGAAVAAALAETVSRPVALLQPLIIGWASLAATGLLSLSPSAAVVRPALRYALASFDAQAVTPRGVWALIAAGAWDVGAAVAAFMPPLDGAVKLAAAAAAGDWSGVQATLLAEVSRALHAPAPPPRGSELHSKLVAAAAGALFHGQFTAASALFQAAGEWPAAMLLAVCQGQVEGVSSISHKVATAAASASGLGAAAGGVITGGLAGPPLTGEAKIANQLATALRNVYGGVGEAVGDLTLTLAAPGPGPAEPLERAERWPLAVPQAAPAAVAVLGGLPRAAVSDSELGTVPPATAGDRASAVSYYALTATAASSVAASAAASGARVAAADRGGGAAGAASVSGASSHKPGGSFIAGDLEANSVSSLDGAQAAARAEFFGGGGGFGPTIEFSSDDSDSEATGSAADPLGGGNQRKIKIQIRDRGSGYAAGAASGSAAADVSLRDAAKGLRLAPPGAPPAGGLTLAPPGAPSPRGVQVPAAPPSLSSAASGSLPPTPSGGAGAVQFPPGLSSMQLYAGGVAFMEAGDWRSAAAYFSRAISVLQHEERALMDDQSRRARLAFCAQYYAAVKLLEAVAGGTGPREARLYRYLGGLNLDPKHSNALLREAITRNRTVRNYRFAGDQLTSLIGRVADTAPAEYLAQIQAEIEECDRHGGRNADIPADEQVADWAMLVAAAGESGGGKEEVDSLVLPLLK